MPRKGDKYKDGPLRTQKDPDRCRVESTKVLEIGGRLLWLDAAPRPGPALERMAPECFFFVARKVKLGLQQVDGSAASRAPQAGLQGRCRGAASSGAHAPSAQCHRMNEN
jgi:hypothetical protein